MDLRQVRAEALRALIKEQGSNAEFARKHGLDASYLSQLVNGHRAFGEKAARKMEEAIGLPNFFFDQQVHTNVEDAAEKFSPSQRRAPVISWVQAGAWQEAEDPFEPGTAEEWEPVPESAGPNSFWLRVVGDSMTAPHGPSIPEGMLILVDPDYPALSGRLVVAKLTDNDQVTFKKLVEDAGKRFLKALNPAYPVTEINGNCRIVGTVREAKLKL